MTEKGEDSFSPSNWARSVEGQPYPCRPCFKAYNAARYAADPEKVKARETAKRRARGVKPKQVGRDPAKIERARRLNNAKRYGLTLEQYDEMMLRPCAICGRMNGTGKRRFHIDHCHKTGKVRGALCGTCNPLLGLAQDNPDILLAALAYLKDASTEGASVAVSEQAPPPYVSVS